MILGTYFGPETLIEEFKEFCFRVDSEFSFNKDEIIKILVTGTFTKKLQSLVFDNLNSYIKYYLPRYMSSFANSNLNGRLIFGINDDGDITGIPSIVELNKEIINKMIIRQLPNYINIDISQLDRLIKVRVEKLIVKPDILDDKFVKDKLDLYFKLKKERKEKIDRYNKKREIWYSELDKYRSLDCVLNKLDQRKEFIQYMKDKNDDKYSDIICRLSNLKNNIKIPDYITLQEMKKDDTCLFYWLMKFKDVCVNKVIKKKPPKLKFQSCIDLRIIFNKLTDLSYLFYTNNTINYYLIIIDIIGTKIKEEVLFKLPYSMNWVSKRRLVINSIPMSV